MWPIVESSQTEFATALLIYWRLGGPDLELDVSAVNAPARQLQARVRSLLVNGYYVRGTSLFSPQLSRVELYKLRRAGVPEVLLGDQDSS
jgi:hypothetical protein